MRTGGKRTTKLTV